jgi:DNA-binding NarL/FixJ family response regulator
MPLADAIARLARQARIDLAAPSAAVNQSAADAADAAAAADAAGPTSGSTVSGGSGSADPRSAAPVRRDGIPSLSARELQVLGLVAAGRTNGQIATELYISPKTASVHVTHILDKLGASNRVEAAMIAARAGLLEPEQPRGDPR